MVFIFGIAAFSWLWWANSLMPSPGKEIIAGAYLLAQTCLLVKINSINEVVVSNLVAGFLAGILLCLMSAAFFPNLFIKLDGSVHFLQLALWEGSCFAGIFLAFGLLVYVNRHLQLKMSQKN